MTQITFDVDDYSSREECIKAKKAKTKELRAEGFIVEPWILKNQQRGYSGYGTVRDMSIRDVFMLNVYEKV